MGLVIGPLDQWDSNTTNCNGQAEICNPYIYFSGLRELRDQLEGQFNLRLPQLSMGMSGDYPIAIEEGATLVRVGTAIFGERKHLKE